MDIGGMAKTFAGIAKQGAQLAGPALDMVKKAAGPVGEAVTKAMPEGPLKDVVSISKEAIEEGADLGKVAAKGVDKFAGLLS